VKPPIEPRPSMLTRIVFPESGPVNAALVNWLA
jgi:hypothetical protein